VGLDESPMVLRGEFGEHALDRLGLHVEPGRQSCQWARQVRILEDQQRALHLHPRRSALCGCGDDDVAVPKLEAVPSPAVHDQASIAPQRLAHVRLRSCGR
jgi:hypothetical protein